MSKEIYKDKKTGKRYIKIGNGYAEVVDTKDLELVKVGEENYTYTHMFHGSQGKSIDEIMKTKFKLKDTITVPIGDKEYAFVVEHIVQDDDCDYVYFVSKDIIAKSSMDDMDETLRKLESEMPEELVNNLREIEHIVIIDGERYVYKSKLNLMSLSNVKENDYHYGEDDILFDGLKTEAERCKNYEGETYWYWLRSPNISYATNFMYVSNDGITSYGASYILGVVPCFSIQIMNC